MKKVLYILRHAKALDAEPMQTDFSRELSIKGQHQMSLIAQKFKEKQFPLPELIIHSAAKRTTQTALLFANSLNLDESICTSEPSIYNAPVQSYLNFIEKQNEDKNVLMIVGHNPSISELVQELLGTSHIIQMPTAGLYSLEFDENFNWADIHFSKAVLIGFEFPENQ